MSYLEDTRLARMGGRRVQQIGSTHRDDNGFKIGPERGRGGNGDVNFGVPIRARYAGEEGPSVGDFGGGGERRRRFDDRRRRRYDGTSDTIRDTGYIYMYVCGVYMIYKKQKGYPGGGAGDVNRVSDKG
jgi:hypothetical protein